MAKANAGVVTKLLKANGFTRTEWRKEMVSVWNDGFDTEQSTGFSIFDGLVYVSWMFAGTYRTHTADEIAVRDKHLKAMTAVLVAGGYAVTLKGEDSENPYLSVAKAE